jgi:hypothetical protein
MSGAKQMVEMKGGMEILSNTLQLKLHRWDTFSAN